MSDDFRQRWAWAEVSRAAISHNVRHIAERVQPASVWAVVKANGYGHGSVEVANAALAGGATALCVALVEEGIILRRAGIDAPILIMSEQPVEQADDIVANQLTATVCTREGVDALAHAAHRIGMTLPVHIKVDTGMHRVGVQPADAVALADHVAATSSLVLHGVYTHFATADDPSHPATAAQLTAFSAVCEQLAAAGHRPAHVHMANSAAALTRDDAHGTAVRIGIAMYGLLPSRDVATACEGLEPALSLRARVSAVRWVEEGEAVSYGLRRPSDVRRRVATIPLGYADGVPRRLWESATPVLIHGVARPICGTVTMDQIMVDCGTDTSVQVGDEVVLIGSQGESTVTADDWATACGTIDYEIVCGISSRIARTYR